MALKQKTVDGVLVDVIRRSTNEPGKQYEYTVRKNGSPVPFPGGQKIYRKDVAMDHFHRTVRNVKKKGGGGGMGGGGLFGETPSFEEPGLDFGL